MSKVKIQGNASGTGIFTVAAPATNADRTITLPDVSATVMTTAGGNISGGLGVSGNLDLSGTGDVVLGRTDGYDSSIVMSATAVNAGKKLIFQKAGGGSLAGVQFQGPVLKPTQPTFWAYRSGDGNVTGETDLSCNVADVNIGGHYSTSTFRFTAPIAGTYFFIIHAMNNQNNPGSSTIYFSKNGSKYHYFHIVNSHPSSSTSNVIMTLAAGDYVSCSASNIHYNGGSIYKYPVFGGYLLG